jgi:hypothetical protein
MEAKMRKFILLVLSLLLAAPLYADVVFFNDGSKSVGKIIKENDKIVVIREVDANGVTCETEAQQSSILKIVRESGETQKERLQRIKEARKIKIERPPKPAPIVKPKPAPVVKAKPVEKPVVKPVVKPSPAPVVVEKVKPVKKAARNCSYRLSRRENKDITLDNIRMQRREVTIVVSRKMPFEVLAEVFECVAEREIRKAKNLDALWIVVMRKGLDTEGLPSAYGLWAPPGGWDDFMHTQDKSAYRWEYRKIKKWM